MSPPSSPGRARNPSSHRRRRAAPRPRASRGTMRILVVEDDPALLRILNEGFREHRIDVVSARTFHEGREKAALGSYAVIILDVGLPGGSGFDLCKRIRANGVSTPVMMLTARDAVDDRVFGLESGADDYL